VTTTLTQGEDWKDFDHFYKDVGDAPGKNMAFTRIDQSKGFFPDNCAWLTKSEASKINAKYMKRGGRLTGRKPKRFKKANATDIKTAWRISGVTDAEDFSLGCVSIYQVTAFCTKTTDQDNPHHVTASPSQTSSPDTFPVFRKSESPPRGIQPEIPANILTTQYRLHILKG